MGPAPRLSHAIHPPRVFSLRFPSVPSTRHAKRLNDVRSDRRERGVWREWDERRGEGEHRETDTRRTEPRREIDGRSLTRHLTVGSVPPSLTSRLSLSSLISLTPLVSLGSFFVPSSLRSCAPPSLTHSVHRDRREPRRVEHSETRRDVTGGHGERK